MLNKEKISEQMSLAGFDAWGVVRAEELSDAKAHFERWLSEGGDYRLDYLRRNVEKRFDARELLAGAKSIIVGAVSYKNRFSEGYEPDFDTRIASYALSDDYHTTLRSMLRKVALGLGFTDPKRVKICVDSVPLAEKSLARLAGIGWQGRNSLIISPLLGSFMVLGALVVPEECEEYNEPFKGDGCVGCGRCLLRCPTGAIAPNRTIKTALCISNRTIEASHDEPFDTRGWVFGCDECQTCCPHNQSAPLYRNSAFAPKVNPTDYDRAFWDNLSPEEAESLFGGTPIVRKFKNR